MIQATITPSLLERAQRGLIENRRGYSGVLPTVQGFAAAIVDAAGRCSPYERPRVLRWRNRLIARHDAHSPPNEEISA